jgi:hypothetical protein
MSGLSWRKDDATSGTVLDPDGGVIARYTWAPEANHPAFHPVSARGGGPSVTNRAPWDHPWHHGLWWSWKFVNNYLFWEDDPGSAGDALGLGRSVVRAHETTELGNGSVRIRQMVEVRTSERILLEEARELTLHADVGLGVEGWAIDWHLRSSAVEDCELRATPADVPWGGYAGLAYRPARSMAWGEVFAADGDRYGAAALHGRGARWAALSGNLDGAVGSSPEAPIQGGVAILSHPANPRHPTPIYAWSANRGDFGFLAASPIFHEPLSLMAGEEIVFRFRALVFTGGAQPSALERAWQAYAGAGVSG